MYTYDVENDISIFDGDFEGYLKDIGVDGEHIKKMQCKILQEDRIDIKIFQIWVHLKETIFSWFS